MAARPPTSRATGGVEPDWSPDGREIVYAYGTDLRATTAEGAATRIVSSQTMLSRARLAAVRRGRDVTAARPRLNAPACCAAVTRPPVVAVPAPAPRGRRI